MNFQDIISGMRALSDDDLDKIRNHAKVIQKQRAEEALLMVNIGDRVRINSQCRPKYLIGAEATVTKVNPKGVIVQFDEDHGKYRANYPVRLPATLMERI